MRSAWGDSCNDCAKPLYSCGSEYPSFVTLRHFIGKVKAKSSVFPIFLWFLWYFLRFLPIFAGFSAFGTPERFKNPTKSMFRAPSLRVLSCARVGSQHSTSARKAPFQRAWGAHPRRVLVVAASWSPTTGLGRWGDLGWETTLLQPEKYLFPWRQRRRDGCIQRLHHRRGQPEMARQHRRKIRLQCRLGGQRGAQSPLPAPDQIHCRMLLRKALRRPRQRIALEFAINLPNCRL